MSLIDAINSALPQTQCTRCGYPDCTAYASAIAQGAAAINQCPPGGQEGIARLAALTGQAPLPLNPDNGREGPRHLAVIDEAWCIGCTLCVKACPTDAIVGANKTMHVVLDEYCTGCELCIPVCPVDCISLSNVTGQAVAWQAWSAAQAETAHARYQKRAQRLGFHTGQALPPLQQRSGVTLAGASGNAEPHAAHQPQAGDNVNTGGRLAPSPVPASAPVADKSATLAAIMAKARAKRAP